MKRLLLHFSYIGTNYRGLQRTVSNNPLVKRAPDIESVQGILEFGLRKILRTDRVTLGVSSRTDAFVHACETTAQFDLDENLHFKNLPYSTEKLCQNLNLFLEKNECDIRVKRVQEVPQDFSCRKVICRTYVFRIGVLNEAPHNIPYEGRAASALDIRDLSRCTVISRPFDFTAAHEASKLFVGSWNFSTFMKSTKEVELHKRVKTLRRFSVAPAVIGDREWDNFYGNLTKPTYDIYNFTVEASGFLRRQVRRMVGALVAVGKGAIAAKDILWMLENPSEQNWNHKAHTLAPHGLYLKEIRYPKYEVLRGYC